MIRRAAVPAPSILGTAIVVAYAALALAGRAPDIGRAYDAVVLFAVAVWTVSGAVALGFSLRNEVVAWRDLAYVRRGGGNDLATRQATWLRKKHFWLILIGVTELGLWGLVFTGPAVSGGAPTQRGVLFALGLDMINVLCALVTVGSTMSRRSTYTVAGDERRGA